MVETAVRALLLHGSIVLLVGLLCGLSFWYTIILEQDMETVRAWRVAHTTLIADGMLLLVIGVLVPDLAFPEFPLRILVWALVLSGYGFTFALAIGACTGYRGLMPRPYGMNTLFFLAMHSGQWVPSPESGWSSGGF